LVLETSISKGGREQFGSGSGFDWQGFWCKLWGYSPARSPVFDRLYRRRKSGFDGFGFERKRRRKT